MTIITEQTAQDIYKNVNTDWDGTDDCEMIDFMCDTLGLTSTMNEENKLIFMTREIEEYERLEVYPNGSIDKYVWDTNHEKYGQSESIK